MSWNRVTEIAADHRRLTGTRAEVGVSADAAQIERAVALAVEWADVADRHSIPFDDLDSAVDLAQCAFDTVMRATQQRVR